MTDRHSAYIVVLQDDLREDDAADTLTALHMIKGVLDVRPVVANVDMAVACSRVDARWRRAVFNLGHVRTDPS